MYWASVNYQFFNNRTQAWEPIDQSNIWRAMGGDYAGAGSAEEILQNLCNRGFLAEIVSFPFEARYRVDPACFVPFIPAEDAIPASCRAFFWEIPASSAFSPDAFGIEF